MDKEAISNLEAYLANTEKPSEEKTVKLLKRILDDVDSFPFIESKRILEDIAYTYFNMVIKTGKFNEHELYALSKRMLSGEGIKHHRKIWFEGETRTRIFKRLNDRGLLYDEMIMNDILDDSRISYGGPVSLYSMEKVERGIAKKIISSETYLG